MSFDYTGSFSGSFSGDITASNGLISSSAQVIANLPSGVVSSSNQVSYSQVRNKPTTISAFQKNSITANNRFREVTYPNDSASFATRIANTDARIDGLSAGSGSADWSTVTNKPVGLISSSTQIESVIDDTYISASAAASGFGTGGGSTDISSLNTFTGSIQTEVDSLTAATSSYLTSLPSGVVSGSDQITDVVTDSYISASAAASGFGSGGGETYTAGGGVDITSNVISIDTSSAHFRLGVSASAASYGFGGGGGGSFGDPPTFDQDGLQVNEFVTSGSVIGTLTVTDVTPGDTATFEIQSGYTDDFFKISTGGVVTANTLVTASMNTTAGSGSNNAHPFLVKVTDGQNNEVTETIYIYVRPNSAPVFRQTSVNGSIITNFTSSAVNENSTNGSTIATIYFTDENSDTITIRTGSVSPADHFNYTINSNNVVITQDTASLDYETYTSYTLSLTASDEHYESGDDDNSFTTLSIRIPVQDNNPPVVNDQTLNSINENSANNAVVDSVVATDTEGDTITWTSFTLRSAYLNGVGTNITSSLGGTSLYDPHANPFQINSGNGQVTRKSGVFLNSDIANRYEYEVEVKDIYNSVSGSGIITIPIADDDVSSIGADNQTYYIIESATGVNYITTNTDGYTTGFVQFSSDVDQRWEIKTVPSGYLTFTGNNLTATGSTVTLFTATDISGNLEFGDSVQIQITASEDAFPTTKQYRDHTLQITENLPLSMVFNDTTANLNTNGARPGNRLTRINFNEPQSGIFHSIGPNTDTFTLIDPSGQLTASLDTIGGVKYYIESKNNLSGSTIYGFTASIQDEYGNITTDSHSITIAQAGTGSISTNGTFYVIESATNGDDIVLGTNGRTGTQGDLGVTYLPQYNSAAVASFTSSNALISVSSNGNLSVGNDISGSGNIYPGTITSNITWRDQYDNVGGPYEITVNLAINNAPTAAELTSTNRNENQATDGNLLSTIKWTDTEGDALNISSFTLTGVSASNLSSSYDGSNNFGLYANGDQSAGTISFTASVEDVHGFRTGVYTDDITIAAADDGTLTNPGNLYVIESATSGDAITNTTTGIGTAKTLSVTYSPNYGSQVAQNWTSDNPFVAVNSSTGVLTVGTDISGSGQVNGGTLIANIGWEDQYGNTDGDQITINITANQAPSVTTDTPNTSNWNENLAVNGALLATLVWSDVEGDALDVSTFSLTGAGAASLSSSYNGSNTFGIYANGDLSAATYNYSANIKDTHGFNQGTYSDGITISQADGGSITAESFYIIESALSGSVITNDSDGVGSQANVNVTYSPNYGTQAAQGFNSNDSVIAIDSSGNLSVKSDISGSYNGGDSISPTIYWEDQYGNEGTGSITINITNNSPATATFANESVTAPVSQGTKLVTITISDTEGNTPYTASLSGEGAASMSLSPQNANSSSWFINASDSSMTTGMTLNYTASITDAYGETTTEYNRQFVVGAAPAAQALWYAYLTEYGHYVGVSGADIYECIGDGAFLGNTKNDGVQDASSILDSFADGDMGTEIIVDNFVSSFFGSNRKTYLVGSGSALQASNSTPILSKIVMRTGSTDPSTPTTALLIVMPSNGDAGLVPTTMGSSFGGSTSGEYLIYGDRSGTGGDGVNSFAIQTYNMNSGTYPNSSATSFTVLIGGKDAEPSPGVDYYLISTSGSAPSSTF